MPENIKDLLYWCKEREAIRLRRFRPGGINSNGEGVPITNDAILATYRFCNVRRRDDRVSSWLIKNVLTDGNIDYDVNSFLMFAAWCRWCNWPPTIKAVMDAGYYPKKRIDWARLGSFVDKLGKKQKVWTGAYMIRAPKKRGAKKGRFVAATTVGKNFKKILPQLVGSFYGREPEESTYQGIHAIICSADGYGSFMAGQIAGDLTYTKLLREADDLMTWAPIGPGSLRGFNRVMGNPLKAKVDPELWQQKLPEWRAKIVELLSDAYDEPAVAGGQGNYTDITALDVQNCLCEVDKYLRVKNGEGRPRARYTPHTY